MRRSSSIRWLSVVIGETSTDHDMYHIRRKAPANKSHEIAMNAKITKAEKATGNLT